MENREDSEEIPHETVDSQSQAAAQNTAPILNIVSQGHSNVRVKEYDGKSNWISYINQFDRVTRMNAWDNKLDILWIHLTGDALTFAEELPDASTLTFEELCKHLAQRFGADRLSNVYKAELLNRRRKVNETLPQLGQDIRQLVNHAYAKFNRDAKDEIAMEKFLDTLKPDLRRHIYQQNPTNLDAAIEIGLKYEAWGLVEETKHGNVTSVRVAKQEKESEAPQVIEQETEQIRLLKELQQKVSDLQVKKDSRRDMTCYHCGKRGHVIRDCYAKKREEGEQRRNGGNWSQMTCYRCGGKGHKSSECATPTEN